MKMPVSSLDPIPQWARTSATIDSLTSGGARSAPSAQVPYRASAWIRSGCRAAIAAASCPPWEAPYMANRAAPAASATAIAAATWLSKERSTPSRSDRPQPGLSYLITVQRPVSRARNAL